MKKTHAIFLILLILITTTGVVLAQPPGLPSTPSQTPVDGGFGLMIATVSGGIYAFKKLRDKKS